MLVNDTFNINTAASESHVINMLNRSEKDLNQGYASKRERCATCKLHRKHSGEVSEQLVNNIPALPFRDVLRFFSLFSTIYGHSI